MRKQLIGIIALLFILGSAFTFSKKGSAQKTRYTYYYVLDPNGDKFNEGDYGDALQDPPNPCAGSSEVCWIEAEDNGSGGPEISDNASLQAEILDALEDHEDKSHVKLRD
jgi:hypothetical protein